MELGGDIFLKQVNPFHAYVLFLYPLKTEENQKFSDFFRGVQIGHWRDNRNPFHATGFFLYPQKI